MNKLNANKNSPAQEFLSFKQIFKKNYRSRKFYMRSRFSETKKPIKHGKCWENIKFFNYLLLFVRTKGWFLAHSDQWAMATTCKFYAPAPIASYNLAFFDRGFYRVVMKCKKIMWIVKLTPSIQNIRVLDYRVCLLSIVWEVFFLGRVPRVIVKIIIINANYRRVLRVCYFCCWWWWSVQAFYDILQNGQNDQHIFSNNFTLWKVLLAKDLYATYRQRCYILQWN